MYSAVQPELMGIQLQKEVVGHLPTQKRQCCRRIYDPKCFAIRSILVPTVACIKLLILGSKVIALPQNLPPVIVRKQLAQVRILYSSRSCDTLTLNQISSSLLHPNFLLSIMKYIKASCTFILRSVQGMTQSCAA